MSQINLANVAKKSSVLDDDRVAIWPDTVTASSDLEHTTVLDLVTKVETDIGGNYVPVSSVDTKGDLYVGVSDNTVGVLPAGSNGQFLVVDSAQSTGLKWESLSTSLGIINTSVSRTLVGTDNNSLIVVNNGANNLTVTIPNSVFSTGAQIGVARMGTGSVTIVAGSGVTINATPGLVLRAQYSVAVVVALSSSNFLASGDLSA